MSGDRVERSRTKHRELIRKVGYRRVAVI